MNGPNYGLTPRELELTVKAMITMVENDVKASDCRPPYHYPSIPPHLVDAIFGMHTMECGTNTSL